MSVVSERLSEMLQNHIIWSVIWHWCKGCRVLFHFQITVLTLRVQADHVWVQFLNSHIFQGHGLNPLNQSWLWNILLLWGQTTSSGKRPTSCSGSCSNRGMETQKFNLSSTRTLQDRLFQKFIEALTGEPGLPCAQQRKWPWWPSAWR